MAERPAHNRLVAGSNPAEPRTSDFLSESVTLKEMLEVLLGTEGKRKLRLRHKSNEELFTLYDSQLVMKHRSRDALEEARRVLRHFKRYLGDCPPSSELATGFLAQFADRKPTTLYRYTAIIKGFMSWYGEELTLKIKVPETLPDYVEETDIEKLKQAMKSKRTHKGVIERNVLLIELARRTGLRRHELADLKVGGHKPGQAISRGASWKGAKGPCHRPYL